VADLLKAAHPNDSDHREIDQLLDEDETQILAEFQVIDTD
jgi:hypothetical protein